MGDVMTIEKNADAILFGETQCKKKMAFQVLSCDFGLILFEIR